MELKLGYDYQSCVEGSEKVTWTLDSVMPPGTRLEFERAYLPEALAPSAGLTFLNEYERRSLNQITGNAYLNLFAFVEEYIIATVVQHAQAELFGDHVVIRALSRFADEEVKHQQLFARYRDAFDRDFGVPCEVLDDSVGVAAIILKKSPIAVMITTLHVELATQLHYTEAVRDDATLDKLFVRLLKSHWLEEAQHARIDALELRKLARTASLTQIQQAFREYLEVVDAFGALFVQQGEMDVRSLERKCRRALRAGERVAVAESQRRAYVRLFLWTGMTHPTFIDLIRRLDLPSATAVTERAASLGVS